LGAGERDEFLRAAWRLLVAGEIGAERLVFVDEMRANVSLSALYTWSRRGQRAFGSAPRNWGKNVTLLASITCRGVGPCLAVEGATTREVFKAYLEQVLAPALSSGQVVVMDNLSAHKGGRIKEILQRRGCELIYLPPYSRRTIEPHRASVRQAQGATAVGRVAHPRRADRGDGPGTFGAHGPGCPRFLRPLRLPFDGSTAMRNSLVDGNSQR